MASGQKQAKPRWQCKLCAADPMVVGWTQVARVTKSFMKFKGHGPVLLAETQEVAEKAFCFACDTPLPATPVELMKAACEG